MDKIKINVIAGSICGVLLLSWTVGYISYNNSEVDIRTAIKASQDANKVVYDRVWKTIQQQTQVSSEYASQFQSIYKEIMDSRNQNSSATLARFIKESNPQFDSSLMKKLMTSIESNRMDFEREQKRLIDLSREHEKLIKTFPGTIFLRNTKTIDINLVTSSKTEANFKTGVDDDIDMYKKK
jgi:hypothetical protein